LVPPKSSFLDLEYLYLVGGYLNIQNTAADPFRFISSREERDSAPYINQASDIGFALFNTAELDN